MSDLIVLLRNGGPFDALQVMEQAATEIESQAKRIAELEAEVAALRADAGRYRYLKSHPSFEHDRGRYVWYLPRAFDGRGYVSMDETIDSAIKEQQ